MGGIVSSVTNLVSDAVETVGDVVGDVGSFVVETVDNTVQAIADDPLKAAAVAAAAVATGGTSLAATLGASGAAAAGAAAASTAIDLSRGEDFDDALKGGLIAGSAAYVGGEVFGTSGSTTPTGAAEFAAADAAGLASQGLSSGQITETLIASGIDDFVAADLGSLASQGISSNQMAQIVQPVIEVPSLLQTAQEVATEAPSNQSLLETNQVTEPSLLEPTPTEVPVVDYSTPSVLTPQGNIVPEGTLLPEAGSGFGLQVTPPTTEFGTFNPSVTSGYGIDTGAASGIEYLGGTGSLAAGTAGLTAEQLATATELGQVGTNASSGLGYLGGSESLPTGTAGIEGVAAPTNLSLSDIQRGMRLANTLFGQQQPIPQQGFAPRQIKPAGVVDYSPILSLLQQRASTPNIYSLLG
jgi:hypothetical protein